MTCGPPRQGRSLASLGLVPAGPASFLDGVGLIDHHCHSVVGTDLDRPAFEALLTEGEGPAPGTSAFDSSLGFSVRRWCSPVLGLPPHATPEDYLARRSSIGAGPASQALMRAAGTEALLVDHGFAPDGLLGLDDLQATAGAPVGEVVRLEAVAQQVADTGVDAAGYGDAVAAELARRTDPTVRPLAMACRTVLAYRAGLDVDPRRPDPDEVAAAAGEWLARRAVGGAPLRDPVLLRHGIWAGLDTGLPLQVHIGFGDPEEELGRCDPTVLAGLARLVDPLGVPMMLVHTYPYHRQAAWMAQVFACVHVDVGFAVPFVGPRCREVIAEMLELAPFAKVLYASDAYGLPELHLLGSLRFRAALGGLLEHACAADEFSPADAERVAMMIARENARRVYTRLPA